MNGFAAPYSQGQFSPFIDNGAVLLEENEAAIVSIHPDTPFVPASILKIATTLLAIRTLGFNYSFATKFYRDNNNILYIKGEGDPFLISEQIKTLSEKILPLEIPSKIILDTSSFSITRQYAGLSDNPYDAPSSSLAVNFNTLNIMLVDHRLTSAESQTPTIPLMKKFADKAQSQPTRITVSGKNSVINAGQLLQAFLGLSTVPFEEGIVPATLSPFFIWHNSHDLEEILTAMLYYSNNFIANQLFLTCGAQQYGYPATWEKGRRAMNKMFHELGIKSEEIHIEEGSGLSTANRITATAMVQLLKTFAPYRRLLPQKNDDRIKSGTLTGVYCYAGYLKQTPFVIMLNQTGNTRDDILTILRRILPGERSQKQ